MTTRETTGYGQFCPIAMASEVLCRRWTTLILREMLCGSTRFNKLRRGLPQMSPALLSTRLRELEEAGIIEQGGGDGEAAAGYNLTPAGQALRPVIVGMGEMGSPLDRELGTARQPRPVAPDVGHPPQPAPRADAAGTRGGPVRFKELPAGKNRWWLIVDAGEVDLCYSDPGFDVDLYVATDLRTMTAIWMGFASINGEVKARRVFLEGDPRLAGSVQEWLGYSPFAAGATAVE